MYVTRNYCVHEVLSSSTATRTIKDHMVDKEEVAQIIASTSF